MICWHPRCEVLAQFRLRLVFRIKSEDTRTLVVPLQTQLCKAHAESTTVAEVLDSGVWDAICGSCQRAGGVAPTRGLTKLELDPIVVGEC